MPCFLDTNRIDACHVLWTLEICGVPMLDVIDMRRRLIIMSIVGRGFLSYEAREEDVDFSFGK